MNKASIRIKDLEGNWYQYKDGDKSEGFISIRNEIQLHNYITDILGVDSVDVIDVIDKGKSYPYNTSNPYREDSYDVRLKNGISFVLTRSYGRPNWTGNVSYKEIIEVKLNKNK